MKVLKNEGHLFEVLSCMDETLRKKSRNCQINLEEGTEDKSNGSQI